MRCMADSAFSQLFSPKVSSCSMWSKLFFRGPSPSFFPTTLACPAMLGGLASATVCLPIFFVVIQSLRSVSWIGPSFHKTVKNISPDFGTARSGQTRKNTV